VEANAAPFFRPLRRRTNHERGRRWTQSALSRHLWFCCGVLWRHAHNSMV